MGPTDLGESLPGPLIAEGESYLHGPMAVLACQIVEAKHDYSPLDVGCCGFLSERQVSQQGVRSKIAKKSLRLPGVKQPKETRYFFNTARIVARIARDKASQQDDQVVAILFRDSDGTASAGRGEWREKRQSMLDGFMEEGFSSGVPMIPKPKSEAWIICALKPDPALACDMLEERSGNDRSPNSLKAELQAIVGAPATRELLLGLTCDRKIDFSKIKMPSFAAFRTRLEEAISG